MEANKMFGHGNKFGTNDDVKARINEGHKLEAAIFVAEWEEGNGFSLNLWNRLKSNHDR